MTSGAGIGLGTHPGLDCRACPDSLLAELTGYLCRSSTERQHLAAALCPFQKVCPFLHHPGAWLQVQGMVVRSAHCIPGSVSKLQLDMVMRVSLLMQDGRRQTTEAVAGHSAFVPHPLQCFQDRIVAHGLAGVAVAGKKPVALPGQITQNLQHLQCLPCQRDDMWSTHFHALCRNVPTSGLQIEFCPLGSN